MIVTDMPEAQYHGHSALSSTQARQLLDSPARYKHYLTHKRADKLEFDLGSAIHSKVLGTGYAVEVIPDDTLASNGATSTKAAREFIESARERGAIPIKSDAARKVTAVAESVLAHETARRLFEQDGTAEASVFATDPVTGVEVRARFDWLAPTCVDLKSARSASADMFTRSIVSYGYDVQEGHYLDALYFDTGERRDMVFVVVETEAPYLVAVHQLDIEFGQIGQARAKKAREILAECTRTNNWPGYPDEVQLLSPPAYYSYENEMEMTV